MKKLSILSLGLLTLLTISGCSESKTSNSQSTKPSAVYDAQAVLDQLQAPLALDGELIFASAQNDNPANANTVKSSIDTYISGDEYYLFEVDEDGQTLYNDIHYYENDEGVITKQLINRHNEVETIEMVYENNTPAIFDDTFFNPFTYLSDLDLQHDGNLTVTIDTSSEIEEGITFGELVAIMLVGEQFEIPTINLTLNSNYLPVSLSFVSEETPAQSSSGLLFTITYTYEAQLTDKAHLNILDLTPYPELPGMEKMQQALQAIQNQNYTLTCYSSAVSETEPTFTAIVTEQGYLVSQTEETYGLIADPNGGVASVVVDGDRLKAVEETYEGKKISDYITPGDYDPRLFLLTDYGYVLMDAYHEINYLLPDAMFNLLYYYMSTPVIFEIADDLSKITYSYSFSFITEGVITVELTNLGTTVFPYNLETDYDPYFVPTSWEEVNATAKAQMDEILNKDLNEVLPFYYPEEGYSYFGTWSGAVNLEISVADETRGQEILEEFTNLLLENGYTYQESNETDEETYINAEGYKVGINFISFFGLNTIQIYIYPPAA